MEYHFEHMGWRFRPPCCPLRLARKVSGRQPRLQAIEQKISAEAEVLVPSLRGCRNYPGCPFWAVWVGGQTKNSRVVVSSWGFGFGLGFDTVASTINFDTFSTDTVIVVYQSVYVTVCVFVSGMNAV